ncbi:putative cytoplasmic dynein intermediate chain [Dipodascopsis uninucleata]
MNIFDYPPLDDKSAAEVEEKIMYSKGFQTDPIWIEDSSVSTSSTNGGIESKEDMERRIREELEQEIQNNIFAQKQLEESDKEDIVLYDLDEIQKSEVVRLPEFSDFVHRSTKVIERALNEDYDILTDYAAWTTEQETSNMDRDLREVIEFYSDKWSKNRSVTAIDWATSYSELCLAAYSTNPAAIHEQNGIVQVWNMHMKDSPEYVFHSQSEVTAAKFSPFHQNLIVGGCYSGQVVIWDTRAKSDAVLRSPVTGTGHTHPIYALDVIGTKNTHSIFTTSTDGRVCGWNIDMLAQPFETIDLKMPAPSRTEDLAPTSLAFGTSDMSFYLVGTEEGSIYPCSRNVRAGTKTGIDSSIVYRGHPAPVTAVALHPANGPFDLSDLFLSSSLDWSVRLWRARKPQNNGAIAAQSSAISSSRSNSVGASNSNNNSSLSSGLNYSITAIEPLLEFSGEDAMYDVSWSPFRPGIFASVGCSGKLDVWNIAIETEIPIASSTTTSGGALNKVGWERLSGKAIAVGGVSSVVTVFEVGNGLSGGPGPVKMDEWKAVRKTIAQLEENK